MLMFNDNDDNFFDLYKNFYYKLIVYLYIFNA